MNVFWLDYDLKTNATYYCDKHVVKMILEYAQLLSTACRVTGVGCGYNPTHINHPCALWVRDSIDNWECLREMAFCLSDEFYFRYRNVHASFYVIRELEKPRVPSNGLTIPPQCMPNQLKSYDVVTAYRNYYIGDKRRIARWTRREVPSWFNFEGKLIDR